MSTSASTFRSKIGNAYPKSEIEDQQPQLKAELAAMKKMGRNRQCFDCGVADVSWASPKLGTFICVTCSDVHRAAGAHITCVKNFSTYLWSPDEVELMRAVGNTRAKEIFRPGTDLSWQPGESKEQKVRHCTKLYGTEKAQLAVKRHIEAATAAAGPGRKAEQVASQGYNQSLPSQPATPSQSVCTPAPAAPDLLGDWPTTEPEAVAPSHVSSWPATSGMGTSVGPWPCPSSAPEAITAQHDLIDLFPSSTMDSAWHGDCGAPASSQSCGKAATVSSHEKDFWSSVNWDELLK
ncbi:GCS1 [Symbiodinium necroappetens]|uniref:GCS1 protein n=1 Tax=Symbiodinium necroappetens TaxID=1628268 RepID=A0A812IVY5_9DINO|nr:GCS1 [Symbiodinium necroappetens]|mmetsp:Transcript_103165/g.245700  ORF Transcript_103165/g.245700 Transcript_103165/m.245700 type:complete len:293 (+) Transcript_103165:58-936(+)